MGFFGKFLGKGDNKKTNQFEKFSDDYLFSKKVQLEQKSDDIIQKINQVDNNIDLLVESSKGKNPSEINRIANRIKTLQHYKVNLERALALVEQQIESCEDIRGPKEIDEINKLGITDEIDLEQIQEDLIIRNIEEQKRDAKVKALADSTRENNSSVEYDEETLEIASLLNEANEGTLEPKYVKNKLINKEE